MKLCRACGVPTNRTAQATYCAPCGAQSERRRIRDPGARPCVGCGGPTGKKAPQARKCKACESRQIADNANRRYHADEDRARANAERYRVAHRVKVVSATREWRARNHESLLSRRREQYAANPGPQRVRSVLSGGKRRATMRNNNSPGVSSQEWDLCLDMFGHRCAYCLKTSSLTVDHVVPISRGGADSFDNVVPACGFCNGSKNASSLLQWSLRGGGVNV